MPVSIKRALATHKQMERFSHYNLPHIVAIGLTLLSCFLTAKLVKNKRQANVLRRVLIIGLITKLLWYHLWLISFEHNLTWGRHLPFHISQVSLLLMIPALLIRKNPFYQFVYYWSGWSSLVVLLFPEVHENFPHPRFLEFFLGYLLLLTSISYICYVEKVKMTYKYLWLTVGALALYCAVMYPVNLILKTNYLFLIEKPELGGPMNLFPSPPWHIPFLVMAVLLSLHLQYLPYYLSRKRRISNKLYY